MSSPLHSLDPMERASPVRARVGVRSSGVTATRQRGTDGSKVDVERGGARGGRRRRSDVPCAASGRPGRAAREPGDGGSASREEGICVRDATPGDGGARRGLQVAADLAYATPIGRLEGGSSARADGTLRPNDLARIFGPQGMLGFEVGAKVQDHIFVGGYLAGSFGGSGTDFSSLCNQSDVSCLSSVFRLGFAFKYHILPASFVNPWLGVGLGYEGASLNLKGPGGDVSVTASGVEMPLSLGADIRLSKHLGIGPKVDFTVAQYQRGEIRGSAVATQRGELDEKAVHSWLTFGARAVFFP